MKQLTEEKISIAREREREREEIADGSSATTENNLPARQGSLSISHFCLSFLSKGTLLPYRIVGRIKQSLEINLMRDDANRRRIKCELQPTGTSR
jgi:hypothetical protein